MRQDLEKTHTSFIINLADWYDVIKQVREKLGNNNHLQEYRLRPWITDGFELYIRNDLLDNSFVTYLGLICKFKEHSNGST